MGRVPAQCWVKGKGPDCRNCQGKGVRRKGRPSRDEGTGQLACAHPSWWGAGLLQSAKTPGLIRKVHGAQLGSLGPVGRGGCGGPGQCGECTKERQRGLDGFSHQLCWRQSSHPEEEMLSGIPAGSFGSAPGSRQSATTDQHSLIIKALENLYKPKVSPESCLQTTVPAALRPPVHGAQSSSWPPGASGLGLMKMPSMAFHLLWALALARP